MADTPDSTVEVLDGGRIVRFSGHLVASASSERSHAPRWTELNLYKTSSGMFVLHRVGRSRVFHTEDCAFAIEHRLPQVHTLTEAPDFKKLSPCDKCRPDRTPFLTDNAMLRVEQPRNWAGVADNASAAIDMLHRNEGGSRHLPWLAANLLEAASRADLDIRNAYSITTILD